MRVPFVPLRQFVVLGFLIGVFLPDITVSQEFAAPAGSLLLIGGRHQDLSDELRSKFFELAGGRQAKIVVIPTATADDDPAEHDELLSPWRELKPLAIQILHTRKSAVANDPDFVKPITEATAVFFTNGHADRIFNAYRGTLVEKELKNLLARGGLVGGTGTGMSVWGDIVVWHEPPEFEPALGILPGFLIGNPNDERWTPAVDANPTLVGLGIKPDAAVLIQGKELNVIGNGTATTYIAKTRNAVATSTIHPSGAELDLSELRSAATQRIGRHP